MADRLALIIANSEFDDPKLTRLATPSRDAEALAEVLRDPDIGGFRVTELIDEPLPVARREVARLFHRRTRDDLLLLYYSGHGFKDDYGELYLAVRDTEHEILGATALDAVFVRRQLDQSNSQRKVVILDCCHSGAFVPGGKAILGSSVGAGEALAGSGYGRVILTASNAVEYAWEGDRLLGKAGTSTFTHHLVHGLRTGEADRDQDGRISLDELYDYVYEQVMTSERVRQTPQKWTQRVEGQITVAQNPHAVIKPVELPSDLRQAIESPTAWMREGAVSGLERLLRGSDEGLALAADEALKRLLDDDSRSVSAAAAQVLGGSPKPLKDEPVPVPKTPVVEERPEARAEREPRRRPLLSSGKFIPWRWIAGAAGLVAVALTVFLLVLNGGGGEIGDTRTRPADGMVMVYVTGGTFQMGSSEAEIDAAFEQCEQDLGGGECSRDWFAIEAPQHTVTLDAFWIDKTEVTNAQYRRCVQDGDCDEPGCWNDSDFNAPDQPVVCVSWYYAEAYCKWAGARLPTEAEWEYAARGSESNTYPWGEEEPACELAQFGECSGGTVPVGSLPDGASWCEALDMAGNVWEWVNDWYGVYPSTTQPNPAGPETGDVRVLRGGSWYNFPGSMRSAYRDKDLPGDSSDHFGFRCVDGSTP